MPWEDNETEVPSSGERIAVLGAHSPTGRHFCRLALDAGYIVQALVPPIPTVTSTACSSDDDEGYDDPRRNNDDDDCNNERRENTTAEHNDDNDNHTNESVFLQEVTSTISSEQLSVIHGELDHGPSLEAVLENATYVVCFVSEVLPKRNRDYPDKKFLAGWLPQLYPLLKECSAARVFLYQASWLAIDVREHDHPMPIVSKIWKFIAMNTSPWHRRQYYLQDQDAAIRYIAQHTTDDWLQFIITRPGLVMEGSSRKKLHASRSLPGPVPITHFDLAEFSLQALQIESLYGTSPYIVGDGF